jgi:hypothetical protein
MGVQVDRIKNQSPGKRGTAKESLYFGVDGSKSPYGVTLNYSSGHFCNQDSGKACMGQISKIRKFGPVPELDTRNPQHWCKHVNEARGPGAFELRVQARKIRNETFGIHEIPTDPETGRTIDEIPAPVTNRRKAVAHTKAKNGNADPANRLAEIEAEREALLKEIADAQGAVDTTVAALVDEHGVDVVEAALKAAS